MSPDPSVTGLPRNIRLGDRLVVNKNGATVVGICVGIEGPIIATESKDRPGKYDVAIYHPADVLMKLEMSNVLETLRDLLAAPVIS